MIISIRYELIILVTSLRISACKDFMFERDDVHSDSLTAIANMAVFLYNGTTLIRIIRMGSVA